jgi:hypothetical protein
MPDEFLWEMAWRRALGIAFLEFSAVVCVCYLAMIVVFFRRKEIAVGILCAACAALVCALPFGLLMALVFGWINAGRWQIRAFMTLWTALVFVAAANVVAAVILSTLDATTLRSLFG